MMRKLYRILGYVLFSTLIFWTLLTLWAEGQGPARNLELGKASSAQKVLIVYDPDPLYNLDQQVCETFANELVQEGLRVRIATPAALSETPATDSYDLYVFCANTYNWQPDWAIQQCIRELPIAHKPVVAITLGAGSTGAAQRTLEEIVNERKGKLTDSRTFWLLRPNDETRLNDANVEVCLNQVSSWARTIGATL